MSELQEALERQECRILVQDPFISVVSGQVVSEKNLKRMNRAWQAIKELVKLGPRAMFDPHQRSVWIDLQVQQKRFSKPHLYTLLRHYWEGGQTRDALLPRFARSGAPGQDRLKATDLKRGRRVKPWHLKKRLPGVNVDEATRKQLIDGAKKFYESSDGLTLKEAYKKTMEWLFKDGYVMAHTGMLVPTLPPEGAYPSYRQFVYWYKKEKRDVPAKLARVGPREFQLTSRAMMGNATREAFGPGSTYQIDSTIVDLNLVSSLDRALIVGRPVLYVVIDTFSRMVKGFSVSFEHASWRAALLALENVTTDKEVFCTSLGLPGVTKSMWPSSHLPAEILADRAEFTNYNSDLLADAFGIQPSNTPPYRADWKPFVERHFGLLNDRTVKSLPGAVRKRTRGSKDTRLDAALDLKAFRRILAADFIDYNNTYVIKDYPLDEDMVAAGIVARPINLWNWGLEHREGAQKSFPPEVVRAVLLPRDEATVTARGLRVKNMYYTADVLSQHEWFSRARIRGTEKRTVSYDPMADAGEVYLHASCSDEPELKDAMVGVFGDTGMVPCRVIEHRGFEKGKPWVELEFEAEIKQERNHQAREESSLEHRAWQSFGDSIVAEEKQKTEQALEAKGHLSKAKRLKGIRENQTLEKQRGREEYASHVRQQERRPPPSEPPTTPEIIPLFHDSVREHLDSLKKSQAEEPLEDEE